MAARVVDGVDEHDLRVLANELFAQWHASVTDVYVTFGDRRR